MNFELCKVKCLYEGNIVTGMGSVVPAQLALSGQKKEELLVGTPINLPSLKLNQPVFELRPKLLSVSCSK